MSILKLFLLGSLPRWSAPLGRWRSRSTQTLMLWVGVIFLAEPMLVHAEGQSFDAPGPYEVSMSDVKQEGLLFLPKSESSAGKKWPVVVFAHGLCGPAKRYSDSLTRIASWGFIVLANQKQEDCGLMDASKPLSSLGNFFLMPFKFEHAVSFSTMIKNVESNIDYLLKRPDVDPDRLGLLGHSMGGGIVFDVAASLEKSRPGVVKAVIGVAPWNGVRPTPSTVVDQIKAPVLIVCSPSDKLCPCSGEVTITDTQGLVTGPAALGIPLLFGPDADSTWHGGSVAIFEHARDATLIEVSSVSHFTIMGTDDGKQMQNLSDWAGRQSGLNFNHPDRTYQEIPTLGYAVAFLNATMNLNRTAGQSVLESASTDRRLLKVQRSN